MKYKKICDKIKEVLIKEPDVLAIFNNGSSVVGLDVNGSDLDFVLIMKNDKCENKIAQAIRRNFKVLKNEEYPEIKVEEQFEVLGRRADFTLISQQEMEKKLDKLYESKESFIELQNFIKHKIIDSVAVYDPNNFLSAWKRKAEIYPQNIMNEVFDMQIRIVKENLFYWKYHKFRNEFQFGFEKWDVIKAICQALYAKNNRMFMLPYKRIHNDLKELKPNIEKEMYELIRGRNTSKNINKKLKIVNKIVFKLESK